MKCYELQVAAEHLRSMSNSPEEWYRSLPIITRCYMTGALATTVLIQMDLLPPAMIHLDFEALSSRFEAWRLFSNFLFFGKFGMPFVFSMFFLVRYGRELEAKRFEGRSADFLWCLFLTGMLMVAVSYFLYSPFLSQSMLSVIVYLWSREYSEQVKYATNSISASRYTVTLLSALKSC